jgi:hypothetical protein
VRVSFARVHTRQLKNNWDMIVFWNFGNDYCVSLLYWDMIVFWNIENDYCISLLYWDMIVF